MNHHNHVVVGIHEVPEQLLEQVTIPFLKEGRKVDIGYIHYNSIQKFFNENFKIQLITGQSKDEKWIAIWEIFFKLGLPTMLIPLFFNGQLVSGKDLVQKYDSPIIIYAPEILFLERCMQISIDEMLNDKQILADLLGPRQVEQLIQKVLEEIQYLCSLNGNSQIYVLGMPLLELKKDDYKGNIFNKFLLNYNQILRKKCQDYPVTYIDNSMVVSKEKGRIQRSRVLAKQILTKMNEEEVFTEKSKRKVYSIY